MIQCSECEYYRRGLDGSPVLSCDPFSTIKEPECLAKWQLLHVSELAQSHRATLDVHRRLAPLQEKMFRHVEREIDEVEEADSWKYDPEADDDEDGNDDPFHL